MEHHCLMLMLRGMETAIGALGQVVSMIRADMMSMVVAVMLIQEPVGILWVVGMVDEMEMAVMIT